jgi:hypothetical protein
MFGSARHPVTNFYPVEVSGWDASEVFFVEKSELDGTKPQASRSFFIACSGRERMYLCG